MQEPTNHSDAAVGRDEVKETTCYMCACRCGIRVQLRDGEVRSIEGNPDHPLNQGVICAKGSAGIMKQYSPARLTRPLRRKAGAERGTSQFEECSWEEALDLLTERLGRLRAEDPRRFAFFTGRDQMQALTGLFAKQFGTPNGFGDGDWIWVESAHGKVRCQCRFSEAVEPGTVWTWNAIGKAAGAWGLSKDADESRQGFLLNHLISEELPPHEHGDHCSNADPVTGQAAWFDVRVRVYKAGEDEPKETSPQFAPMPTVPGQEPHHAKWQAYVAGLFGKVR